MPRRKAEARDARLIAAKLNPTIRVLRRAITLAGVHRWRRLSADEGAVTSIEFAIVFIPFIAVAFCVLELGVTLLFGLAIESTTQQIARLIKTGQLQKYNIQSAGDFRSKLLCPSGGTALLPAYLVCSFVTVDVRTTDALGDANLGDDIYRSPSSVKFCLGGPASVVVVRVAYAFPAILPVLAVAANGSLSQSRIGLVNDVPNAKGWYHILFKTAAFQNESYGGTYTTCS